MHIADGNHKLIRWKLVIHAGIDGYSRLIVYMHCSDNNRAETVFDLFIAATQTYFIPSRVRSDKGLENIRVAEFKLACRGFDRGSMITGSSVHNQRIERLWRDMFRIVILPYYRLFYSMEASFILNPLDDTHLFALHHTYIRRINQALREFQKAWNFHGLSSEKSASPLKLFTMGVAKLEAAGKIAEDFYSCVDDDYGRDLNSPIPILEDGIIVEPIQTQVEISRLHSIDIFRPSNNDGIDIYLDVLNACNSH